ncbi:MAG: histone deacetylase [Deltaproteobacteria bacterium RBG_13_52_11b]|nr:MAG: histone deacetylase [Deltaproteobacteria bacterium RBG_13_52_11b]
MKRTGIVKHETYMEHVMDPGHPESPERLRAIYQMLEEKEMKGQVERVKPREATREELLAIHSPDYIDLVASTAGKAHYRLDMDTSTSAQSYEAAILAAGGLMELVKAVMEGKLDNGFALVRPPGHHAERTKAMGFCVFNNVAIAAMYAIKNFALDRILIVDWDVHHGNGTQHSFYEDPRVLYVSTHRYGFFFPGTGAATEVGRGKGEGFTVNIPISSRGDDSLYGNYFDSILKPIALEYKPQLVLVSAGFDIHYDDPLGGMEVTPKGFSRLTQILMEIAEAAAHGKLVITLEGGYSISGQCQSVKAVLKELSQNSPLDKKDLLEKEKEDCPRLEQSILQIKAIQRRYWKSL